MRILLVGEYSRLHNSLKEGLTKLGHNVTIIGNGDGFKNYPVDIYLNHSFQGWLSKKIRTAFYKLTSFDLASFEIYLKAKSKLNQLSNYDIVQLINESPLVVNAKTEKWFIKKMIEQNKRLYLLSCGIDHQCMKYMMSGKFRYSIMSPYLQDKSLFKHYKFQLQYLNKEFADLHNFIYENSNGIIASDIDYHLPLVGNTNYLGLIPNPINLDKIKYIEPESTGKIKIFHGVNTSAITKKGNKYFTEALSIIEKRYSNKVEITTTYSIPYNEYIQLYNECHILMDQVYGYDQGYNALEAMAKGKVVFTGAEQEWLDHYKLQEDTVAINALPDVNYLVEKLSWLIENPTKILEISKNARAFVAREHDYLKIAKKYLEVWNNN